MAMARTKGDPDPVPKKKKARTKEGRTKAEKEAADREFEEEENQEAAFEKAWREEAARRLQRIQEASKEEREEGEVETPPMAPRTPIDSTSAPMALRTLRLHQSTSPKKSIASPKAAAGSDSSTAVAGRGGARGGTHPRTEEDDEETDAELCLICSDFDCQCPPVFVEALEAFRSP